MIRLAPYPYSLMNAVLSATTISLPRFSLATAISLIKLCTHTLIGANIETLHESMVAHPTPLRIAVMGLGTGLGIGLFVYVWVLTKRTIKELEEKCKGEEEEEIGMQEVLRRRDRRNSNDDGGGGYRTSREVERLVV